MITKDALIRYQACYWHSDGTARPDTPALKVEANLPATLHQIMTWDWIPRKDREWVFDRFATAPALEAYNEAVDAAAVAYDESIARAAYEEAIAPALAAYAEAKAKALIDATKQD